MIYNIYKTLIVRDGYVGISSSLEALYIPTFKDVYAIHICIYTRVDRKVSRMGKKLRVYPEIVLVVNKSTLF